MRFPSLGFRHKDNLKVILRHYIGCFFGENIFLYIGWSGNNSLDKTLVCTKNCNDILFLFVCFSAGQFLDVKFYPFRN